MMQGFGHDLFGAIEKVDALLDSKPEAEKTRDDLARENADAMARLNAMLAGTKR